MKSWLTSKSKRSDHDIFSTRTCGPKGTLLLQEEREVLQSIYENEDHFKQHSETVFTFRVGNMHIACVEIGSHLRFANCKIGEPGDVKSYSVEIRWGEGYPDEPPTVSLDSIYNSRL